MIRAPSCRVPSGPTKCRSNGSAPGPSRSASIASGRLALGVPVLRRLDDLGVHAERDVVDEDPLVHRGQVDAPLDRRAEGVERGRRRRHGRGRGRGRSGCGCRRGRRPAATSAAIATLATSACDPSPPAMPITSAPRSIASRASWSRSSPGWRTTGSMPRRWHSSTRANRSAFPPPDLGFMIRTPWSAGSTWVPGAASTPTPADRAGGRSGRGRPTRRASRARLTSCTPCPSAVSTTTSDQAHQRDGEELAANRMARRRVTAVQAVAGPAGAARAPGGLDRGRPPGR